MRPFFLAALPVALFVGVAPGGAWAGDAAFRVAPAPAWITGVEAEGDGAVPEGASRDGVYQLLSDREVRVTGAGVERYLHVVRKIVSAAGVESASELRFDFDPPHEQLVLHHIRVVRGKHAEDALRPREIHVIQQESDLSHRIYNGTLTAVAFLRDVRAGDVVDYAFSLKGRNPVLGERFSDTFLLVGAAPLGRLRLRLSVPVERSIALSPHLIEGAPEEQVDGKERHFLWELRDVAAPQFEDQTPRWFNPLPRVEVTEYTSFAGVAAWALPLFEGAAPASTGVAAEIENLRRAAPDAAGRMLAALRFVQNEVRYLGIELGPHSHKPQPPATVLERRFGDCKDKTLLLVTLLRGLGVEAQAALVNPDLGRGLDERAPSPLAFNHVIVRASTGGRVYWLDPTLSAQRGGLETLPGLEYERALVVAPETAGLTPIPGRELSLPEVEEHVELDVRSYDEPALMRVHTVYRGGEADGMRREVEAIERAELSRANLNYYARDEPAIEEVAAPVVVDDEANATLTITESYRIPDFWREDTRWLEARLISRVLPSPGIALRTMPLRVSHPSHLVHETKLILPAAGMLADGEIDLSDAAMSLRCQTKTSEATAALECRYQTARDFVPAAEAADHLRLAAKIRDALAVPLTRPRAEAPAEDQVPWPVVLGAGGIAALAASIYYGIRLARWTAQQRRKHTYRRQLVLAGGEAPATAIAVASREALERRALRSKCRCGAAPGGPRDLVLGKVVLGERAITSVRIPCAACGKSRSLFFELPVA